MTARESALPLSGQGAGLGRAEHNPRNSRKHINMQGQKKVNRIGLFAERKYCCERATSVRLVRFRTGSGGVKHESSPCGLSGTLP